MKRKLLSLIICLCLAVSMIPAPVAVADGRNRNPFSTAEEIINETVNNLEVQPTETPEKTQEDYASKTIDNKSFTQSKTDIKTSDNISRKSVDNKTVSLSMQKKATLGSTQGTTEVTLGENGAETFYAAFELCRDNGGIIHITRDCDTSEDNQSERQDTLIIYSDITLDIQDEATVSGNFEVESGELTITGNGTFAATCIVEGGTLNVESGIITGSFQKSGSGEIVAPNYVLTEKNGYLYANEVVCRIGDKGYATLKEAIDEADGKTITVIANINEALNIIKQTTFSLEVCEDFCVSGTGFKNNGASITIKNGKFDTPITNESGTLFIENGIFLQAITNESGTISITGGTFSQDVSEFCAKGYECLQISGTGKFQVAPIIEAQIIEANGTVQEKGLLSTMLNDASAGQTVQLLRNCDYSNKNAIHIQKEITLDLNGYTLNTSGYRTTDADTIDSATLANNRNPGILTSTGSFTFKAYNTYLPMFDNQIDSGGYRFFKYTVSRFAPVERIGLVEQVQPQQNLPTLKYRYAIKFPNNNGYRILAQGGSGVILYIGVKWSETENLFNMTTDEIDALRDYGAYKYEHPNDSYLMFIKFWNYKKTLSGVDTTYRLHVTALSGKLPIRESIPTVYRVDGNPTNQ